jgi:hypothetical protein
MALGNRNLDRTGRGRRRSKELPHYLVKREDIFK